MSTSPHSSSEQVEVEVEYLPDSADDDLMNGPQEQKGGKGFGGIDMNEVTSNVGQQVAANVLSAGKERAQHLVSNYARLDLLRPLFDVEPADIRSRLVASLWPQFSKQPQVIAADLYGPIMLALTLSAVLLMGMKTTGRVAPREGTLTGSAMALSFGYWVSLSGVVYALGFVFNTNVTLLELASATGYSLFGYCCVLASSHILPGSHHDFFIAWTVIGLLSALRLGLLLRSRTPDAKQGLLVCLCVIAVHWTYLLYLNFAYTALYTAFGA